MSAADDDQPAPTPPEPGPCAPCRGTGRVISRFGGEERAVTCPWCEGSGIMLVDHDAQAARRESGAAESG